MGSRRSGRRRSAWAQGPSEGAARPRAALGFRCRPSGLGLGRRCVLCPGGVFPSPMGAQSPSSSSLQQALAQVGACLVLLPRFLLTALMLWLLDFLCLRKKLLLAAKEAEEEEEEEEEGGAEEEEEEEPSEGDPPLCVSDSNRMFTWESLKAVWHGQKLDFFKAAQVGCAAPNPEVIGLEGRRRLRLLDFARGPRPLILNFGSCT